MADTGWKSPSSTGRIYNSWVSPSNAYSSNNNYALENRQDTSNTVTVSFPDLTGTRNITLSSSEGTETCGGSTDLWGESSISPSTINDSGFELIIEDAASQDYGGFSFSIPSGATIDGIEVAIEGYGSAPEPPFNPGVDYIDHIQVKVYYTESGTEANSERKLYVKGGDFYSRESTTDLESDDTPLATTFSEQDYTDVESDDNVYVDLQGTARYMKFLFKEFNENETNEQKFTITWKGKSSVAPSSSTVYLQVYNRTLGQWETLDSDSTTSANTKFTLTGTKSTNLSGYYDSNYVISVRVYQDGMV